MLFISAGVLFKGGFSMWVPITIVFCLSLLTIKFFNFQILYSYAGKLSSTPRIEEKFLKQILPNISIFRLITEYNNSGISILVNHSWGFAMSLNKAPFEKSFCIETQLIPYLNWIGLECHSLSCNQLTVMWFNKTY